MTTTPGTSGRRQPCDVCGGTGEIWLPSWQEDEVGRYVLLEYVGPCEACRYQRVDTPKRAIGEKPGQ